MNKEYQHEDELFPEVVELVKKDGYVRASRLQRIFKIGYARSAFLIDEMEEAGIITPPLPEENYIRKVITNH